MQPKIRAAKRIDPSTAPRAHRISVDMDDVCARARAQGSVALLNCACGGPHRRTLARTGMWEEIWTTLTWARAVLTRHQRRHSQLVMRGGTNVDNERKARRSLHAPSVSEQRVSKRAQREPSYSNALVCRSDAAAQRNKCFWLFVALCRNHARAVGQNEFYAAVRHPTAAPTRQYDCTALVGSWSPPAHATWLRTSIRWRSETDRGARARARESALVEADRGGSRSQRTCGGWHAV